jgi:hypothetical protein
LDRTVNVFTLTLLKIFFPLCKHIDREEDNKLEATEIHMETNFQENLLISEATNKGYSHILIIGDFNYPDIDWENWNTKGDNTNSHEYKFVETIQDNFLIKVSIISVVMHLHCFWLSTYVSVAIEVNI